MLQGSYSLLLFCFRGFDFLGADAICQLSPF